MRGSLLSLTSTRPPWLRVLAWTETAGGAFGLFQSLFLGIAYPNLPAWQQLLTVAFFGANLIAGVLLLQQRENGIALSFVVQLLQIVFWNSGIAWIARVGFHVTPIIASTGVGVYAGAAAEFFANSVTTTTFSASTGLALALKLGFFWKPLEEASVGCGVNLVALFFTLQLWRALEPSREATAVPPSPPVLRAARWPLPLASGAVVLAALFVLFGGPKALHPRRQRWVVTTGDTLELFRYDVHTSMMLNPVDKSVSQEPYLWVQFRSDFRDTVRDRTNAAAVAQMSCRVADSVGVHRILVQPTVGKLLGLVRFSRDYSFRVDTLMHCSEPAR